MNDGVIYALDAMVRRAVAVATGAGRQTVRWQDMEFVANGLNYPILGFGGPDLEDDDFYRDTRKFISFTAIKRRAIQIAPNRFDRGSIEFLWNVLESVCQRWMYQAISLVGHDRRVTLQRKHLDHVRQICLNCSYIPMTQ
jgi:histone H3/H4